MGGGEEGEEGGCTGQPDWYGRRKKVSVAITVRR